MLFEGDLPTPDEPWAATVEKLCLEDLNVRLYIRRSKRASEMVGRALVNPFVELQKLQGEILHFHVHYMAYDSTQKYFQFSN